MEEREGEEHVRGSAMLGMDNACGSGRVLKGLLKCGVARIAGTPVYCAPEVLKKQYGLKSDIWSCGICAVRWSQFDSPVVLSFSVSVSVLSLN